ncbi:MAG: hypothetical protein ABIW76_03115 [Fibrobacteria bacterium]
MRKPLNLSLVVLASLLVLRCNTAPENHVLGAPPKLPSAASMSIPDMQAMGAAKQSAAAETRINVGIAYAATLFWTGVVAVALTGPVALFEAAVHTEPVVLPDSSGYQWVLSHGGFSALLTAQDKNGSWDWKMTVMSGNNMSNFTWFTGTSSQDGSQGNWTFYRHPDGAPIHSFVYAFANSTEDVKVMIVDKGAETYGSYLHWNIDKHIKSLEGYNAQDKGSSLILYNSVSGTGKMEDRKHGNSYCWDTKFAGYADIPCSQWHI